MTRFAAVLGLMSTLLAVPAVAEEGEIQGGIPRLDHVFVIMLENHGYAQIIGNSNALFLNTYARSAGLAANYYAVGHPSLPNYLEVAGGSNFGIVTDNPPDWHDASCVTNLASGTPATDSTPNPCPISGSGLDAATPAIAPDGEIDIDGTASYAAQRTVGKSIADQLDARHMSWKAYEEDVPVAGADRVDYSDGFFSNLTDFSAITPVQNPPLTSDGIVHGYAVKHNPFAYFASGETVEGLARMVGFDGAEGLYADLASGRVPDLSFIVPDQCHDQHGLSNAGPFCQYDPNNDGTQAGLNPALIQASDVTVQKLVTAIHGSRIWRERRAAIVVIWDEGASTNQVAAIVDTNYRRYRAVSAERYTHFSLLKTIEAGFGLPCLNHACDPSTAAMRDLFAQD